MRSTITLLFLLLTITAFSQTEQLSLDWGEMTRSTSAGTTLESINLSQDNEGNWEYHTQFPTATRLDPVTTQFVNIQLEPLPYDLQGLVNKDDLPSQVRPKIKAARARDKNYGVITFNPFVNQNGQIKRVVSAGVNYAFAKAQF